MAPKKRSRPALAAKPSQENLPVRSRLSSKPAATMESTATAPAKKGLAELRERVRRINARAAEREEAAAVAVEAEEENSQRTQVDQQEELGGDHSAEEEEVGRSPAHGSTAPEQQPRQQQQAPRSPSFAFPSPHALPPPPALPLPVILRGTPIPQLRAPSPFSDNSSLTYADLPSENPKPAARLPQAKQQLAPILLAAGNGSAKGKGRALSIPPALSPSAQDLQEEPLPPAQQPRRPYSPRPRAESVQPGFMAPKDLLASFLRADRAIKRTVGRRRDFDEDVLAEDVAMVEEPEEEEEEDLPSATEMVMKAAATSKTKGRTAKAKSSPPLSDKDDALTSRRTSTGTRLAKRKASPSHSSSAVSSDPFNIPEPTPKRGKKRKERKEKVDWDTEALMEELPQRRSRSAAVLESEEGVDEDGDEIGYQAAARRRPKSGKTKVKKASTYRAKKGAKKVEAVDEEVDSELEREKQKRLREYEDLKDFAMEEEKVLW